MKTTLTLLSQAKCLAGLDEFLFIKSPIRLCSLLDLKKSYFKIIKSLKYHISSDNYSSSGAGKPSVGKCRKD